MWLIQPAERRTIMKKILIIVIALIAVGVGAFFLFFNKPKDEEPKVILYNYAIEDAFIANVKDSQKQQLVKASVILVVNKEKMDEFLGENIYIIRDTILSILRSLTAEDIASADIMDKLREEIPAALNKALEIDTIVSVYFGDFVMQ
jgi:flagellar basal body-associated protein FliL